jgi:hypothetical protein
LKRKSAFLVICMFFVLCNAAFSSKEVDAWLNGNNALSLQPNIYKTDYQNTHLLRTTSRYFGTHDWIAECALDLVFRANPSHPFVQMLWANVRDMRTLFLFGTEAPDAAVDGITIQFPCSDGLVEYQSSWTGYHSLRFHAVGTLSSADLAVWADELAGMVQVSLINKQCVKASFLLGAMCHFIADAVFYPHLIENPDRSSLALLRSRVGRMTTRKLSDWIYSEISGGEYDPPFFDHDSAWSEFYIKKPKIESAYLATWFAGYDTYFGEAIEPVDFSLRQLVGFQSETHRDAYWLEQYTMPDEFDINAPERRKSFWDFFPGVGPDAWKRDYLEAIYHNLNVGVYYCAAAMNSIIDNYWDCDADEVPHDKTLAQSIEQLAAEYSLSFVLSFVGNWAVIIILTRSAMSLAKGESLENCQELLCVMSRSFRVV